MTPPNPKVDAFIGRAPQWRKEMKALREILLDCDLTEELKWGKPCYTGGGANIAIVQPFNTHLALMFFKGALLADREGILRSQGANTRSALRMEFTSPEDVTERATALRAYVEEAVAVEEAGLAVPKSEVSAYEMPAELEERLSEDDAYRRAFEALTPGRKKSYLLHFAGAKRPETRQRRIEKCRAKVLEGKGYNER